MHCRQTCFFDTEYLFSETLLSRENIHVTEITYWTRKRLLSQKRAETNSAKFGMYYTSYYQMNYCILSVRHVHNTHDVT